MCNLVISNVVNLLRGCIWRIDRNEFYQEREITMPIFEYKCSNCQNEFELLLLSGNQKENEICPQCDSKQVERQLSAFAKPSGNSTGATCKFSGGPT